MGGGGGYRKLSRGDLSRLEEVARKTLREGTETGKRNVFISFSHQDLDEVNLLRGQAKNENSEFEFSDWSLREPFDSDKAEYIRRGIRERIKQCSVTLVYLTPHSAGSKWVDWEIRESARLGKGVVGVYKGDSPPRSLPAAAKECSVKLVPWKHKGLAAAIERASETRGDNASNK